MAEGPSPPRLAARVRYRHRPVGVVARHPTRERAVTSPPAPPRPVTGTVPPGELIRPAGGRDRRHVALGGADTQVRALRATPRGL